MDKQLEGQRMKTIVQLVWDISDRFGPNSDGLGEHIPELHKFGQRAEDILSDWFGENFNIQDYPPAEELVIGFSPETTDALEEMQEVSARLGQLIVADFGIFEDREDGKASG